MRADPRRDARRRMHAPPTPNVERGGFSPSGASLISVTDPTPVRPGLSSTGPANRRNGSHSRGDLRAPWAIVAVALLAAATVPAGAKVLVTPEAAIREAFGDAPAEKHIDYLDEAQAAAIAKAAGSPPSSRIVISWRAAKEGHALGTAYLETHVVRTLPETILVVLDPEGRVAKVEILSFDEPDQYRPRERWMDQFRGRALDTELSLSKRVRGVTGATLSSRAITSAVRRVLATHAALSPVTKPPRAPGAAPAAPSAPGSPHAPSPGTSFLPSGGGKPRAAVGRGQDRDHGNRSPGTAAGTA